MTSRRHSGERIIPSITVDEKSDCCNQRVKLGLYVILPTEINSKLIKKKTQMCYEIIKLLWENIPEIL